MLEAKIKSLIESLSPKSNICGIDRVLRMINNQADLEAKLDHYFQLEIGNYFSTVAGVEFEKRLENITPHDLVLNYRGSEIVVEVRRIRKTERHIETIDQLIKSDKFIEIIENGEFGKLIRIIRDGKCPQLENNFPNIIFFVSKDIFFRAIIVEDAANEILRYQNNKYYPNYEGGFYNKLNAIFHLDENTRTINSVPVYENTIVLSLMKELKIKDTSRR